MDPVDFGAAPVAAGPAGLAVDLAVVALLAAQYPAAADLTAADLMAADLMAADLMAAQVTTVSRT